MVERMQRVCSNRMQLIQPKLRGEFCVFSPYTKMVIRAVPAKPAVSVQTYPQNP